MKNNNKNYTLYSYFYGHSNNETTNGSTLKNNLEPQYIIVDNDKQDVFLIDIEQPQNNLMYKAVNKAYCETNLFQPDMWFSKERVKTIYQKNFNMYCYLCKYIKETNANWLFDKELFNQKEPVNSLLIEFDPYTYVDGKNGYMIVDKTKDFDDLETIMQHIFKNHNKQKTQSYIDTLCS